MTCNNFQPFIKNGFNFDFVFKSSNFKLYNTLLCLGLKMKICSVTHVL